MTGMSMIRRGPAAGIWAALLVVVILTVACQGCNSRSVGYPPLGKVTGVLTREGQPLEGMTVLFQPVAGGRASVGFTDSAGRYSLRYTEVADGAMVGDQTVMLVEEPDDTNPKATLRTTKGLDKRFSFTVQEGTQTFDIEIAGK